MDENGDSPKLVWIYDYDKFSIGVGISYLEWGFGFSILVDKFVKGFNVHFLCFWGEFKIWGNV